MPLSAICLISLDSALERVLPPVLMAMLRLSVSVALAAGDSERASTRVKSQIE